MSSPVVFVIDDEENLRDLISEILRDEGYEVYEFAEGKKALAEASLRLEQSLRLDLILTDVNMPNISGIKLAGEIRKLNFKNAIILFSGESGDDLENLKLTPGVTGVESKPYVAEELIRNIAEYIDSNPKD